MKIWIVIVKRQTVVVCASLLLMGLLGSHPLLSQSSPGDSLAVRQARQDWMQADFSLDNSAYAATRKAIDKQIKEGAKPSTLVQTYRLQGKDVGDTRKIFRWAYAVYREQKTKGTVDTNALIGSSSMMNRNLRPSAYDWIRLRFLIASMGELEQPDSLIPVGRRLLLRVYNDPEVMFRSARLLSLSQDKENRRLGLALARDQLQKDPTNAYKQWEVSDATRLYLGYAGTTFEDNNQMLGEMKKTLRMLPSKDPNRKRLIEAIVVWQLHYDAQGNRRHPTLKEINQAIANTTLR